MAQWWKVGRFVKQYIKGSNKEEKTSTMHKLEKSIRCYHTDLVYAQKLSARYKKKEVEDLDSKKFNWGKMSVALTIEDRSDRDKLIETAIKENWSTRPWTSLTW